MKRVVNGKGDTKEAAWSCQPTHSRIVLFDRVSHGLGIASSSSFLRSICPSRRGVGGMGGSP